jgi:hypothetical protein
LQAYFGSSGNVFASGSETVTISIPQSSTPTRSSLYGGIPEATSVDLPNYQMFAKPLSATSVAVFAVNHATVPTRVRVEFASVPGLNYQQGSSVALYNVWTQAPLGDASTEWDVTIDPHDSAFIIIKTA